jgi:hypothetical protein
MKKQRLVNDPMPKLWQYNADDQATWAWLDCIVAGKQSKEGKYEPYISKWIKNPNFKYSNLVQGY